MKAYIKKTVPLAAAINYGPGPVNFVREDEDVTASGTTGKGTLAHYGAMFVPLEAVS